jgi:hypothetical protein
VRKRMVAKVTTHISENPIVIIDKIMEERERERDESQNIPNP